MLVHGTDHSLRKRPELAAWLGVGGRCDRGEALKEMQIVDSGVEQESLERSEASKGLWNKYSARGGLIADVGSAEAEGRSRGVCVSEADSEDGDPSLAGGVGSRIPLLERKAYMI